MGGAVSAAALSKYEKGQMRPSRDVMGHLCRALEMGEDFFVRPLRGELGRVSFRKRSSLSVREERAILGRAGDFFDRYAELEDLLGIVAGFKNPLADFEVGEAADVEEAARRMREAWGLGETPLASVVGLLEQQDLLLYAEKLAPEFDGFAGHAGERPVAALNLSFTVDRVRFSALHELGHLVLVFRPGRFSEKEQEGLCHRFSGAMLAPEKPFREAFGGYRQHIDVRELVQLKAMLGMSCAAVMMRAGVLGLVAPTTLDRFWTGWSIRGYRTNDPGECLFPETPRRFDLLLARAVAEERISLAKAADLAGMPEEEFRKALVILP